jgi:flagellar motor protein MotB
MRGHLEMSTARALEVSRALGKVSRTRSPGKVSRATGLRALRPVDDIV